MRIKLSFKLFGAFFMILALVVGAMFLSRYIFELTFRNYIQQVDLEKLHGMVPALQAHYREHGSWEGICVDEERWRRLLNFMPDMREHVPSLPSATDPDDRWMPPLGRPGGPPAVLLMDARQQPIIGRPAPDDQRQLVPIDVDGQIVGWLGLHRPEPFRPGPPPALSRQLYLLGGVVIILVALIAFLFSRHLLRPIQRLTRGTLDLANRNFAVHIKSTTSDELGQLADNFNAMAHTLDNYEQMRRQWLTDISHELRTPLAVLRGEIEALQDGVRDPTPPNLASLHAEIIRLSKLVEDLHLLALADSDRLHLNKQRIAVHGVLEESVRAYQTRFTLVSISVDTMYDDLKGICIEGDAHRLGQVFANILENVCRYATSPGILKIIGQAGDRCLTLSFQDSGPGVPHEVLARLFDRLFRVDPSRNRESGGSGLGLSICRQIIENHKGRIWAENSPIGGLTIAIELPLPDKKNRSAGDRHGG